MAKNVFKFGGTINNLRDLRDRVAMRYNAGEGVASERELLQLEVFGDDIATAISYLESIEEELRNNGHLAGL